MTSDIHQLLKHLALTLIAIITLFSNPRVALRAE